MATPKDKELARQIAANIGRIRRSLHKRISHFEELSVAEKDVIRILLEQEQALPSELCKSLNISSQFMSQILKKLETLQIIVRKPSAEDKRKTIITLTPKGHKKIEDSRQEKDEWLATMLATQFSASEKEIIKKAFDLLSAIPNL